VLADRDGEIQGGTMTVSDERALKSAYITHDGRYFRALYNPNISAPRWFIRSFVVGPDGAPGDIREYPERFSAEQEAWDGARQAADGST
jgi:hypothetical protein